MEGDLRGEDLVGERGLEEGREVGLEDAEGWWVLGVVLVELCCCCVSQWGWEEGGGRRTLAELDFSLVGGLVVAVGSGGRLGRVEGRVRGEESELGEGVWRGGRFLEGCQALSRGGRERGGSW